MRKSRRVFVSGGAARGLLIGKRESRYSCGISKAVSTLYSASSANAAMPGSNASPRVTLPPPASPVPNSSTGQGPTRQMLLNGRKHN